MVNINAVPVQPFAEGITAIVATMGVVPVLVAVKDGMVVPLPLANPIAGMLFIHVNVVPATGPLKGIAKVVAPLQ